MKVAPDRSRLGLQVSDGDFQKEQFIITSNLGHQVLDYAHHLLSSVEGVLGHGEEGYTFILLSHF